MVFRIAGAIATLVIGLGGAGGQALAQYYPPPEADPPQAYPPPQGYAAGQSLPSEGDADDDAPPLNAPVLQGPPLPRCRTASERAAGQHPIWVRNSRLSRRCRVAVWRPRVPVFAARLRAGCRNEPLLRHA